MRSDNDLRAAGQRAALQPVPSPPPLSQLQERANKHRTKRRVVGSGVAALALAAVSIPVALNLGSSSTTVQDVVAGTGEIAPAAQIEQPASAAAAQDEVEPNQNSEQDGIRIQVSSGDDFSLSINVISGDRAVAAADAAAAGADETLTVEDDLVVWVSRDDDQTTVSGLVEATEFVQVTGSTDQLDKLIEVLRDGGGEWQGFSDFEWDHGDFEFDLDFDGRNGPPVGLEQFLEGRLDGDLSELEGFLNGLDRDIEGLELDIDGFDLDQLEQFLDGFDVDRGERDLGDVEQFLDNAMPQIEQFFENGDFSGSFGNWGANFDGCIVVEGEDNLRFEFPQGCSES